MAFKVLLLCFHLVLATDRDFFLANDPSFRVDINSINKIITITLIASSVVIFCSSVILLADTVYHKYRRLRNVNPRDNPRENYPSERTEDLARSAEPSGSAEENFYETVDYSSSQSARTPNIAKRPPYPLPIEETGEESKEYIHYDTVYEHRLDRMIAMKQWMARK